MDILKKKPKSDDITHVLPTVCEDRWLEMLKTMTAEEACRQAQTRKPDES